jgi:hypothetical protein
MLTRQHYLTCLASFAGEFSAIPIEFSYQSHGFMAPFQWSASPAQRHNYRPRPFLTRAKNAILCRSDSVLKDFNEMRT